MADAHTSARQEGTTILPGALRGGFDDKDLRAVLEYAVFKPETIEFERTYAVLEVKGIRLCAFAIWSYLGYPATESTAEPFV